MATYINDPASMDKSTTVKAVDMLPAARAWAAGALHVDLADDDELTLALHRKAEGEREEQRAAARQRLLALLGKMDEKTRDLSDDDMDRTIEEALQFVRSSPGE